MHTYSRQRPADFSLMAIRRPQQMLLKQKGPQCLFVAFLHLLRRVAQDLRAPLMFLHCERLYMLGLLLTYMGLEKPRVRLELSRHRVTMSKRDLPDLVLLSLVK